MGINLVVAVTDDDWFEMLRQQPNLSEVNFWAPSAANFRALQPGEMFLFKLHAPRNVIVGGGIFAYANALPCSLAWEAFRRGQRRAFGAGDARAHCPLPQGRSKRSERFRDRLPHPDATVLLRRGRLDSRAAELVAEHRLVQDLQHRRCARACALWDAVNERLSRLRRSGHGRSQGALWRAAAHPAAPWAGRVPGARDGYLSVGAARSRRSGRCRRLKPRISAPMAMAATHEARNGLLLRRDIHSLFDAGYVTVTPDLQFEVSRRIKEEFENGRHYYALHGHKIDAALGYRADALIPML